MSYDLGRACAICGADISDGNPDGIGATCRAVWTEADRRAFNEARGLDFWKFKVDAVMTALESVVANTKFRSKFKLEVLPSFLAQWKEHGRISRKQLDIAMNSLPIRDEQEWKLPEGATMERDAKGRIWRNHVEKQIKDEFKSWMQGWRENLTDEQRDLRLSIARKLYNERRAS